MKQGERIEIEFSGATPVEAGRLAEELGDLIRRDSQDIEVSLERSSADAMDLGATLVLILGTPVAISLARGVADWIRKRGDPDLVIKRGKDEIRVQPGLSPDQKFELVKTALTQRP